ncbi:MAG TPA: antitoxin [Thermoanaerobaculia bacterium]|nr:antitoxin [Thermoanaerobaculia bacterium]
MRYQLTVPLEETELEEIREAARAERRAVGDWARDVLLGAKGRRLSLPVQDKLQALREAARHQFPTANLDQMLAEIERGYLRSSGT